METEQRIFGLDLLRVTAIIMILLAQCIWVLPLSANPIMSQVASLFHYIGLEIFFVLGGFLLGNSMNKLLVKDLNDSILNFIKKRAIQILPLYYLVLAINYGIAFCIGYPVAHAWKYVVLLQNFASPIPAFFSESWGLPIIVFATILFSVVLAGLNAVLKPNNRSLLFLMVTLLLIILFFILKYGYNATTHNTSINQWYTDLKPLVIYRLDAVFIGALFSWMRSDGSFFTKTKWFFAAVGAVGIGFIFIGVGHFHLFIENYPFFWNVIYLPLTSLSIAFFLPLFCEWKNNFARSSVQFLSRIAFAVYMVHFGIVLQLMKFYFPIVETSRQWLLFVIAYLTITFVLGFIFHRLIQKSLFNRSLSN